MRNLYAAPKVGLLVAVALFGCDGPDLCKRCDEPPEVAEEAPPSTGNDQKNTRTVTLTGWNELIQELKNLAMIEKQRTCAGCGNTVATTTHHINNTTFVIRFAPPWFNTDQRSLFTSYVVFSDEARFDNWIADPDTFAKCHDDLPASVCPGQAFYEHVMYPFLSELAKCATEEKVELRTVGFASSSGLKDIENDEQEVLQANYDNHINEVEERCQGDINDGREELDPSNMFNLIIANQRAENVRDMLNDFVSKVSADKFNIDAVPWCSHKSMAAERLHRDDGDPATGLMNLRVEVRLVNLPGCLNVDPDNRLDPTH